MKHQIVVISANLARYFNQKFEQAYLAFLEQRPILYWCWGITEVCVINASLKLKPGCGLHVFETWACLVVTHVCNGTQRLQHGLQTNGYRCHGGSQLVAAFILPHSLFKWNQENRASLLCMWSTITPFLKTSTAWLSNKLLSLQPVHTSFSQGKVSWRHGGLGINTSLDLTPFLKRHFLKTLL